MGISDMQHPLAQKIHHYVERMARSKADIFDETNRKRGPPESGDALDAAKRQKLSAPVATPIKVHVPPLSAGPHTLAEVFTVTPEEALRTFDVGQLPEDLVVKIGVTLLQRINATVLEQTINVSTTM